VAAFAPNASPRARARRREKRSGYRLVIIRTLDLYLERLIGDSAYGSAEQTNTLTSASMIAWSASTRYSAE
jgi:hypothetical protein